MSCTTASRRRLWLRKGWLDKFVDSLYAVPVQEVSIIEDYQEKQTETDIDIAEDTLSIINKEIDSLENIENKTKLKVLVKDLYMESLTL